MAKAYLAVRAEVSEADRARFDHWYQTDHLPWALRVFQAKRAWRCWSNSDAANGLAVHVAFYEFDSVAAAEAIGKSDAIKPLVEDFDRTWQGPVTRRRAVLDVVQEIEG
jgi:hypothetical protein